jgi:N-acetyl-anhydromuramyl-L-alanine amidase AmpD
MRAISVDKVNFPSNQYFHTIYPKKQIVIHHTASGKGASGDIAWWKRDALEVATPYIIERSGIIKQLYDPGKWAYHLGTKNKTLMRFNIPVKDGRIWHRTRLHQRSIGIELDSWGFLTKRNSGYYSWTGKKVDNIVPYENGFRGESYFEAYTDEAIKALEELLLFLSVAYKIPLSYNYEDQFELSYKALVGEPGLYSHASYREDKWDCHPQPELIQMLKSLK